MIQSGTFTASMMSKEQRKFHLTHAPKLTTTWALCMVHLCVLPPTRPNSSKNVPVVGEVTLQKGVGAEVGVEDSVGTSGGDGLAGGSEEAVLLVPWYPLVETL